MTQTHTASKVLAGTVGALGLFVVSTQAANADTVTVKNSDTVWSLAKHYGVSVKSIEQSNGIKQLDEQTDLIFSGQTLKIGKKSQSTKAARKTVAKATTENTYTVKAGDSLWGIADANDVSVADLLKANGIEAGDVILPGQKLSLTGVAKKVASVDTKVASKGNVKSSVADQATQASVSSQAKASSAVAPKASSTSTSQKPQSAASTTQASSTVTSKATSTTAKVRANTVSHQTVTSQSVASQASSSTTSSSAKSQAVTSSVSKSAVATQQSSSQPKPQSQTQQSATSQASQQSAQSTQAVAKKTVTKQAATSQATQTSSVAAQSTASAAPKQSQQAPKSAASAAQSSSSQATSQTANQSQAKTTNTNTQTNTNANLTSGSITGLAQSLTHANIPYVWGGSSLSGMDCSGFVAYVFQHAAGISLPHSTTAMEGAVSQHSVSSAKPGDLLFWGSKGATYHVGIYLGNNTFAAAPQPGQNVDIETISGSFAPSFAGTVK